MSRLPAAKTARVALPLGSGDNAAPASSVAPTGPLVCGRCRVRLGIYWTLKDGTRIDTRKWRIMRVGATNVELCEPCWLEAFKGIKARPGKMHNRPLVDQLALPGLERDQDEQKPRPRRKQRMGA